MSTSIQMGNDEFILYIRKNCRNCSKGNADLGKRIWVWIHQQDGSAIQVSDEPCRWGENAAHVSENDLPKTAVQFRFQRSLLPELYAQLDVLGAD